MTIQRRALLAHLALTGVMAQLLGGDAFAESVAYTYDDLGRIKTATYSNGAVITYNYDANGNRTSVVTQASANVQATLTANPMSIPTGGASTLTWTTTNATSVSIDQGIGVVPNPSGSIQVSPGATTTYTLTAQGPGGPITRQATVTVTPAPFGTLVANPTTIAPGQSSTLTWTSTNATSANIDNGVGAVTPVAGGSVPVTPNATTTYTLTVTGPGGSHQSQATVTVSGFSQTIQITGTGPVNLRTLANNAGYNGAENATILYQVGAGVTIMGAAGAPAGGIAIDTGTWPAGYVISLSLEVSGKVYGGGGRGAGGRGDGAGSASGAGGDAVYCSQPITITVNSGGEIKGGGGGGGGGGGWWNNINSQTRAGGGGGGGFPNGAGGPAGVSTVGGTGATNGASGTTSGGGAGGAGDGLLSGYAGGAGGNGGAAAAGGSAGVMPGGSPTSGWRPYVPAGAGGAGFAIRKNGHTVPVTNNGTITGTVS